MTEWDEDWADQEPAQHHHAMPDLPIVDDHIAEGVDPLGYDRGHFFYLSRAARQVFCLSPAQHNQNTLMAMASVPHYWERTRFRKEKGGGIDWSAATDDLMRMCRAVGIYDPDRIRGRGAWLDDGRPVLHMGDHLIVGDQVSGLRLVNSRHIYEAARRFTDVVDAQPLSNAAAAELVRICRSLRWERGLSGALLAGFIAIAPICGGLSWRPSIWITGGKGSGKSWAVDNILTPSIGLIALRVQSNTTEPGIRRALGSDARPVLFDEAEQEDAGAVVRFQAILGLVRQSSSEGAGEILKAAQGDGIVRFRIRSCFAFSSINVGIVQGADESRITVLALREPEAVGSDARRADIDAFEQLQARVAETITSNFSAALVARSLRLLPVIRHNAEVFARAVSIHVGSRRLGDQVGALLAGMVSLHHGRIITPAEAEEFIKREEWANDWSRETERSDEKDEDKLLARLTQARVTFSPGYGGALTMAIGRLIACASGLDDSVKPEIAIRELGEHGFRYEAGDGPDKTEAVVVSNTHKQIQHILAGTPWASGWNNALARLAGANRTTTSVKFGPGQPQARGIRIPLKTIIPPDQSQRAEAKAA